MSFLASLSTLLGTKAAATAGAAVLAAGGVTVAAQVGEEAPPELVETEDDSEVGDEPEDEADEPAADGDLEGELDGDTDDETDDEADGDTEGDVEEDLDEDLEEDLDGGEGEGGEGRSETAKNVHSALTDGQAVPGDEDFGRIVSENARDGGNGQRASEAARGSKAPKETEDEGTQDEGSEDEGTQDEGSEETADAPVETDEAGGAKGNGKGKPSGR